MPMPQEILKLIARFDEQREAYHAGRYNEAQLRKEFLDPFFEALGWDVSNKQGYAEAYKDVIHEDAIRVGSGTKAPDYCFRIGGTRKFFMEAKKPAVKVKEDISAAYQLRRYAWSAKLPLSILSDFEEFAVYDCRIRPDRADKAAIARTMYLSYTDYPQRWDEIAAIFSREAVLKGSFDRYAESTKAKKGTAEVDDAFLQEIESWREDLAHNLALRNLGLTTRQLNFAVQHTIDRIIFLRICEDRGIEIYGRLMALLNSDQAYARLCQLFREADDRYNSGLFHFRPEKGRTEAPDELSLNLNLDDKLLKEIIRSLYYPDSPYEFSVLPADILGQVYEQFLGKVIRLTPGHRAVVEDKPEVKKAGGVYYTPTYIVEYIVKNTVGRLVGAIPGGRPMTPRQVAKLRILDPACGSGSFLISAYQYLLDWHRDWYVADDPKKWATGKSPALYQTPSLPSPYEGEGRGGGWRLTTAERKRILLNNIYGVDIDPQAVEVTKLSLLLKVLEGENEQTLATQLRLFHERALPDLGNNIKCGNSLIGPDFYDSQQVSFLDEEERYRLNVFDWQAEFPEAMQDGGFDVVIGNPPYVRQEGLGEAKAYYQSHYKTFRPTADLYVNFIEKELGLLKPTGLFGMIVSNKWLRAAYGQPLREFLTNQASVLQVVDLAGLPVFADATVRTIILICSPSPKQSDSIRYLAPVSLDDFHTIHSGERLQEFVDQRGVNLPVSGLSPDGWSLTGYGAQQVVERVKQASIPLTTYIQGKPFFGIKTGFNDAFIIDMATRDALIAKDPRSAEIIKPVLAGRDVRRYAIKFNDKYLIWTYIGVPVDRYPAVFEHLKQFQPQLQKRWDQGNFWWELRACDYYDRFEKPKIIYPDIATTCRFALDSDGYFSSNTTYFIPGADLYLLGILNSRLGQFYFSQVCAGLEGGGATYLRFFGQYLEGFPVRPINFSDAADKARHDRMVALVEQMLALHKQLAAAKTPDSKTFLQRQIEATDKQIDRLVYELYGLTEEEVRIVEEGTR